MKSLLAILLLASTVLTQDACKPGSFFKLDCNMCSCSTDGSIAACTMMACPKIKDEPKIQPVDTLRKTAPKQMCEPLKPYRDYCNECVCSSDGTLSICTKMFCDKNVWNKDGSMKIDSSKKQQQQQQQVCTPKSRFQENCNSCLCSDDGLSKFCTMMDCDALKLPTRQQKQICSPRSTFVEECNTCVCSEDGLSKACTMKFCSKDNSEIVDEAAAQQCQPGMTYSPDGCNTCICNKYGTASACTFKLCVNDAITITRDEPNVRAWGPKYNQGDSCTPNSVFYSECNQCVCLKDGKSAYCTFMWCGALSGLL
uniref:Pacifastin domain-containing protein n=1 Tax=Trichogramma kaykai TaxID=54128 RepID=A0ABD2W0W0_9HYME